MRRAAFSLLALLFLASAVPSYAQSEASTTEAAAAAAAAGTRVVVPEPEAGPLLYYDVRGNLSLRCSLPNDNTAPYIWKKNGTSIDELWDVKSRSRLEEGGAVLAIVGRATEDDWGNYSCSAGGQSRAWSVRAHPVPRLPANTNVVEGQKLKIQCKVTGKPYPRVRWGYTNSSDEGANFTEVREALGDRVLLQRSEQGVEDGELVIAEAARSDAGRFSCWVEGPSGAGAPVSTSTLRVKDMYAALWPFLGICAEVFVLCAIILVYEKRRTKPELDDSDTDNHDQKKS